MNVKTISRLLLAFSVGIIYFAMTMDITVSDGYSRFVNFGLVNDRNNLLMLGCAGFIAGIILFATAKMKQTPEEALTEKAEAEEAINTVKERAETLQQSMVSFSGKVLVYLRGLDNPSGRFLTALFVGLPTMFIHPVMTLLVGLYATRSIAASRVMTHLLSFNAVLMLFASMFGLGVSGNDAHGTRELEATYVLIIFLLILFSISIGAILYIKRNEARKRQVSIVPEQEAQQN